MSEHPPGSGAASSVTPPGKKGDVGSGLDLSLGVQATGGGYRSQLPGDVGSGLGMSIGVMATGSGSIDDAAVRALPAGTVLRDRYVVQALLGVGGMGAVYRVHDRDRGRDVALKVLLPSLLAREKAVERFTHEAELTLQLSHENIVRVFDVGIDRARGLRFFTMELLEGLSLRAWLEEKKKLREAVEPQEALEITRQLLEALRYAHRTTVHRDLKPENMFVVRGEPITIKVLDFGIAKLRSASQFTSTSMALGTAYYMAPEQQLDAATVDARADLYSVSVILYEMLTGELPVGRFKTPSDERKGLPPAIDEVVLRGLERKAEARPASAETLLEELKAIRRLLETGAGARATRDAGRRVHSWRVAAGLVLVIAVLGAGAGVWRSGVFDRLLGRTPGAGTPAGPVTEHAETSPPAAPRSGPSLAASAAFVGVRFVDVAPATRQILRDDPVRVRGRVEGGAVRHVEVEGVQAAVAEDGTFEVPLSLREGPVTIRLAAFGPGAERLVQAEHSMTIDRTPPALAVESPEGDVTRAASVTLRGTANDASALTVLVDGAAVAVRDGRFEVDRSLPSTPAGVAEATFEVVARDIAGNEARVRRRVVVDRVPPVLEIDAPRPGAIVNQASAAVQGRVLDAHPAHVRLQGKRVDVEDGGRFEAAVPLTEGQNEIILDAFDRSGNPAGERTVLVHRDTVAPSIRLRPLPERGAEGERFEVEGDVDEDDCRVFVDGAEASVTGRRFASASALPLGERTFEIVARDRAGNEARATAGPVRGEDRTPPQLDVLEAPADGSATREAQVRLRGRVLDRHPSHVLVGPSRIEVSEDGRFDALVPLPEGATEIRLVAYDTADQQSPARSIRVERDSRPPALRLTPLPAKAPESGRIAVTGEVDEDGCRVTVSGAVATVRGRRFEAELVLENGDNTFEVVAADRLGNESRASATTRLVRIGWSDETLPRGLRRGRDKPVLIYDTGKGLEIEMVFVPAGDFVMGWDDVSDTEAEHYGARPEHTHPVPRGFFIGRHETTWREYRAFCRAAGRPEPTAPAFAVQENHPVVNVSWNDAKAFCEWAGLRLPGEAEWEKAARGTNGRPYPWGDDDPENELLNWSENWLGRTTPVGTYPRGVSPYGAFDMAGNVSEWCDDWFDARASERYARGDTTPPASGSEKVMKGGSFGVNSPQSWRRIGFSSSSTLPDWGFRPAKSLE